MQSVRAKVATDQRSHHSTVGIAVAAEHIRHFQVNFYRAAQLGGRRRLQPRPVERALGSPDQQVGHLRVARRARQIAMAEQNLSDPDVGAALEQLRGEPAPQRMDRHPFGEASRRTGRPARSGSPGEDQEESAAPSAWTFERIISR